LGTKHDCHEIYASRDLKVLSTRWTSLTTHAATTAEECFKDVTKTAATAEWVLPTA
jgi:hypothetical protein